MMKSAASHLIAAILLLAPVLPSRAQETNTHGIPPEVYYLMPAFGDGMVIFDGQTPAQGKLNICALDNSLRFLDENGKELEASDETHIVRVRIDTVQFLRNQGVYYRMYPLRFGLGTGIALRRDIKIQREAKVGAYGASTETSAVTKHNSIYVDGISYNIEDDTKERPYTVEELLFLYDNDRILPFTKKRILKLFPERKAEIEAWFADGNTLPNTLPEALGLLKSWAR